MEDISSGIKQSAYTGVWRIIGDRKEAIHNAIAHAREGDTVIITGKGSESYMRIAGGKKIAWSDADIIRSELEDK